MNSSPPWRLGRGRCHSIEALMHEATIRTLGTLAEMKRLIINADDFGLAPGVNRAIVELQQAGALSSTTLMATAPYFSPAVYLAFAQPALSVGCHVVLVDGSPLLRPDEVPSLLDPRHSVSLSLRPTVGSFLRDLMRGRIRVQEIEAEAIAQIRRIQSSGVTVSHIDSHKHIHSFPRVLAPLLRAAKQCGVDCVRNPFEPSWSLRATRVAGAWRRAQVHALRSQRRGFLRLTEEYGMLTADGSIGVLATGSLDAHILRSMLHAMPEGTWELVCHPGYLDRALEQAHTRLLASRDTERSALLEVVPEAVGKDAGLSLTDFHQVGQRA
jgi:chitin disaccharide deacetylase